MVYDEERFIIYLDNILSDEERLANYSARALVLNNLFCQTNLSAGFCFFQWRYYSSIKS